MDERTQKLIAECTLLVSEDKGSVPFISLYLLYLPFIPLSFILLSSLYPDPLSSIAIMRKLDLPLPHDSPHDRPAWPVCSWGDRPPSGGFVISGDAFEDRGVRRRLWEPYLEGVLNLPYSKYVHIAEPQGLGVA